MFFISSKQQSIGAVRHLLAILLWSALASPVMAATDSHRRAAEEFLGLINFQKQLSTTGQRVTLPLRQRLSMVRTDAARAQLIRDHISAIEALVNTELSWANNKADYIRVFTETYSEDELRELVTFFRSPTGQKFLADKPVFNQKIAGLSNAKLEALKPRLDEMEKQLKQKMDALPKPEKSNGQ